MSKTFFSVCSLLCCSSDSEGMVVFTCDRHSTGEGGGGSIEMIDHVWSYYTPKLSYWPLDSFVLQTVDIWGIFSHHTRTHTHPSPCPLPLVRAPHPVPPHTQTPTHTHQLSNFVPSLSWATDTAVNVSWWYSKSLRSPALPFLLQILSRIPDKRRENHILSGMLTHLWNKYCVNYFVFGI